MRADFGGFSYPGTVVEFCAPWFRVVFSDGDSADYTGFELAPLLDFSENDFYDPRLWFYDFSVIHPMEIPAFRRACLTYVESFGLDLPPTWCNAAGGAGAPRRHKVASAHDDTAAYIAAEEEHLAGLTQKFLGGARAPRTYGNLRNPGLKLIWFQASRGRSLPPSSREATAYFTKVAEASDTVGGVALAKSALGVLCSFNELPTAIYTSMRVTAAAVHGLHREEIRHLAGVDDPNWLAYYNRSYLAERIRVSQAIGL